MAYKHFLNNTLNWFWLYIFFKLRHYKTSWLNFYCIIYKISDFLKYLCSCVHFDTFGSLCLYFDWLITILSIILFENLITYWLSLMDDIVSISQDFMLSYFIQKNKYTLL